MRRTGMSKRELERAEVFGRVKAGSLTDLPPENSTIQSWSSLVID